jgi:hypothetical protein
VVQCAPRAAQNVAAGGAFAGPVGIWAVGSLAGGLAFLVAGAFEPVLHRA